MTALPPIHTMYWDNIPPGILEKQRAVFEHLGLPLKQERAHKQPHGQWMNALLERHASDDIVVICDIDAFPLKRTAYEQAIAHAERGALFGLAQFSNHKPGHDIYAGPMFMAFRKRMWESFGRPDLQSSKLHDAAEVMTALARQHGVELVMPMPTSTLISKWALGYEGVFGIGTFYGERDFFHLFESRKPAYEALLAAVADDVVQDKPLDFSRYLEMVQALEASELAPAGRRAGWKFWKR